MIRFKNLWMVDIGPKHETLAESKAKQSKAKQSKAKPGRGSLIVALREKTRYRLARKITARKSKTANHFDILSVRI
jgi:hypothetical protein